MHYEEMSPDQLLGLFEVAVGCAETYGHDFSCSNKESEDETTLGVRLENRRNAIRDKFSLLTSELSESKKNLADARKEICVSVAHHGFSFPVSEEQDISFDPADYATRRGWNDLYESTERQTAEE